MIALQVGVLGSHVCARMIGVVDLRRGTKLLLSSCSAVSIVRPSSCLAVELVVMLVGGFVLQLLFGDCLNSVVKLLGGWVQSEWCRRVGGWHFWQLLCFKSNCEVLGLWLRAQTRSSSCLAAGCKWNGVVLFVGGIVQAVAVF